MALKKDRNSPRRDGVMLGVPVAAGARIFAGAIVGITNGGFCKPAGADAVAFAGVAQEQVDNRDGGDGEQSVTTRKGVFAVTGEGIKRTDIGKPVKALDDESVKLAGAGDVVAGTVFDVDDAGVWVKF